MNAKSHVLVVDDEADIRELLGMTLARMGVESDGAATREEALALLATNHYDLCLTDMRLPDGDGLSVLEHVARNHPSTPVAVITAHGSTENAVAALKAGAFDYLAKPVSLEQLRALIRSALNLPRASQPRQTEGAVVHDGPALVGNSLLMEQARRMIDKLARSQAPVHVTGESGSGKELAARLIHDKGSRQAAPFVPVNCGAIPDNLMESEFFGYRKGAFTGATADRDGFFQAANSGTLFLDEVADLPLQMQVKLLRAIQEKKVRKVGSTSEENVDVRIISATHRNLAEEVKNGKFRQDLYYRLNVIELRMPSLREMREDIPMLAQMLLTRLAGGVAAPRLAADAAMALQVYDFPGNVRELENVLERALTLASGEESGDENYQLKGMRITKELLLLGNPIGTQIKDDEKLAAALAEQERILAEERAEKRAEEKRLDEERADLARRRVELENAERELQESDRRKRLKIELEERAARERIESEERAARLAREAADRAARQAREAEDASAWAARQAAEERLQAALDSRDEAQRNQSNLPLPERLDSIERQAIMAALEKTHYNRTAAARLLGMTFRALRYRLERLGIKDELDAKR